MKPTTLCYAGAADAHGGYSLAADDDASRRCTRLNYGSIF